MSYTILTYCIYLPLAILLTVWVANKLLSNARVFYVDIFHGQNEQAVSLNKLIQVGFYLMALGLAFLRLEVRPEIKINAATGNGEGYHYIDSAQELIEALSIKFGGFVVILGVMLFLNLILILSQRNRASRGASQTLPKEAVPAK